MNSHRQVLALFAAAVAALALSASAVLAATPKDGTFVGATDSGRKISIKVDGDRATVNYCNYKMKSGINRGKFKFAYKGPGGVYVGGQGEFTSKRKAAGKITTDFLCDTEGQNFTATLK
jgi:hypothetical protein